MTDEINIGKWKFIENEEGDLMLFHDEKPFGWWRLKTRAFHSFAVWSTNPYEPSKSGESEYIKQCVENPEKGKRSVWQRLKARIK
jgi:hypothetical protein